MYYNNTRKAEHRWEHHNKCDHIESMKITIFAPDFKQG
jgi:hypothetical protein